MEQIFIVDNLTQSIISVETVGSPELMAHHAQHFLALLQHIDIYKVDLESADIIALLHAVVMMLAH